MTRKKALLRTISRVKSTVDKLKFSARRKLGRIGLIMILPYRGYGNHALVSIGGRVLEGAGLDKPEPEDSIWKNMKSMIRRYTSKEIPFVRLSATFQGETRVIETDNEGYFDVTFPVKPELLDPNQLWHLIHFELLDTIVEGQGKVTAVGEVVFPDSKSDFGIISDIDDTVLISHTTRLLKVIRLSLAENATTRLPFHGVSAFYQALHKGKEGDSHNPIFYVSSSPWNLYDVLADFFEINHIPKGPIMLRDIGISETKFIKEKHSEHKPVKIRHILNTYPELPFILVGDSGQHDPEIYQQIIQEFPGRILVAYIRDVTPDHPDLEIQRISELIGASEVEMVLCADTEVASKHALAKGFIHQSKMDDIHIEKEKDEKNEDEQDDEYEEVG